MPGGWAVWLAGPLALQLAWAARLGAHSLGRSKASTRSLAPALVAGGAGRSVALARINAIDPGRWPGASHQRLPGRDANDAKQSDQIGSRQRLAMHLCDR
jgi:hypothetical protein